MRFGSKSKNSALQPFFWGEEKSGICNYLHDNADVTLSEDKQCVYVEAAVPGMNPEEIELNFDKGILSIKADKKEEEKDKDRKFYHKTSKHFFYQIAIPGHLDEKKAPEALCKDGILRVRFSKLEETPCKKTIPVKRG